MVTANFDATAGVGVDAIMAQWWISIEGIRRRYGATVPGWASAIPDTLTNRPIRNWFEKMPRFKGQEARPLDGTTKPHEFEVRITDFDDELTDLFSVHDDSCGIAYMTVALAAGGLAVTVDDASVFTSPCDIFINRETMRCTNIVGNVLTVTRGMYDSEDVAHPILDSQGNALRVMVADKLRFAHTRECVLYECRAGLLEVDAIAFRGFIDTIDEDDGVWVLRCSGFLKRIATRIGETFVEDELYTALWGADEPNGETSHKTRKGSTTWCVHVLDGTKFPAGGGHVIIDDEIIKYISTVATGAGVDCLVLNDTSDTDRIWDTPFCRAGRGIFSNSIFGSVDRQKKILDTWDDGRMIDEQFIPWFMSAHAQWTKVRQVMHSDDFTGGTTPAEVILQLLTSTGTGLNGAYDTLPAGWGAGIPVAKINSADIRQICWLASPDIDLAPFCITEPTDLKKWLEENVLRPLLLFFVENPDGVITVRRLWSKTEALRYVTPTVIDQDPLIELPRFSMGEPPIGQLKIECNWDPGSDDYWGKINVILGDGRERYAGVSRTHEIEIKTVYDSRLTRSGETWHSSNSGDVPALLATFLEPIWENFSLNPCPIMECEVPYNRLIDVCVGDVITFSCSITPDLKASARGVASEYFQIIAAKPDPEQTGVKLTCWMIGVHDDDTRLLAPSARVTGYTDPSPAGAPAVRVDLADADFANGATVTLRGTATDLDYDVDAFFVGDEVMLVTLDHQAIVGAGIPEEATIDAKGNGVGTCWIDLTVAPANPPGAGDYIDTARYDSCVANQKADWAYLADANAQLGAANDDAHKRER